MSSSLRQRWSSLSGLAKLAALAALLAVVVLVFSLYPILLAAFIPAAKSSITKSENEDRAKQALQAFADYQKQFDGRSLFFTPAPLASDTPPEPTPTDEAPKDPPKPSSYGGPPIIAMINDAVWFDNGKRLKVGDEKKDDMKVVKISPPWEATIEWKGVEFAVNLFGRDSVVLHKSTTPADSSTSLIDPNPDPKPQAKPDVKTEPKPATPPPTTTPETAPPPTAPPATPPPNGTPPPPPGDQTPPPPSPPPSENPQPQTEPSPAPSETPKDPAQ